MRAYKEKIRTADNLYKVIYFIRQSFAVDSLRLRASFIWITENIAYDVKAYQKEDPIAAQLNYVIANKKAICGGYAALLKFFCDAFNIENRVIEGYGRTGKRGIHIRQDKLRTNHAWNAVNINGVWRLMDATWAAGFVDDSDEDKLVYYKDYEETYYFTAPDEMILNHFPTTMQFQYVGKARSQQGFIKSPLFLTGALAVHISAVDPDTALIRANTADTIFFRFKTDTSFISLYAFSDRSEKAFYETSPKNNNGWIEFKYPVKLPGTYNLFIGCYLNDRTRLSLLGYKLEVK